MIETVFQVHSAAHRLLVYIVSLKHACNTAGWLNHTGAVGLSAISVDHCEEGRSYKLSQTKYLRTYMFLLDLKYFDLSIGVHL